MPGRLILLPPPSVRWEAGIHIAYAMFRMTVLVREI
jgi:hypothetical protein